MTWIAAECPTCHITQEMPPWGVLLEVGVGVGDGDTDATATWVCVTCHQLVGGPIELALLAGLVAAGAPLVNSEDEDETEPEPGPVEAGLALTFDDLIDFHESLQQDDSLAELRGDNDLRRGC